MRAQITTSSVNRCHCDHVITSRQIHYVLVVIRACMLVLCVCVPSAEEVGHVLDMCTLKSMHTKINLIISPTMNFAALKRLACVHMSDCLWCQYM